MKTTSTTKLSILTIVTMGLLISAVASPAFARSPRWSRFSDVEESACPNIKIDYDENSAACDVADAVEVQAARVGAKLTADEHKALGFYVYGAVDLQLVPDADSSSAYFFTRWLLDAKNERVGVISYEGWYNSEMETSARFDVRYNLKGEIVSMAERPI